MTAARRTRGGGGAPPASPRRGRGSAASEEPLRGWDGGEQPGPRGDRQPGELGGRQLGQPLGGVEEPPDLGRLEDTLGQGAELRDVLLPAERAGAEGMCV